jgi:hypothetical protein
LRIKQKYTYFFLDAKAKLEIPMKKTPLSAQEIRRLRARYRALNARLGSFDSISQGSVMAHSSRAYIWTRKVRGKTVTRGLSAEKALQMKQAIANYRELEAMISEMREITQNLILNAPEIPSESGARKHPKQVLT